MQTIKWNVIDIIIERVFKFNAGITHFVFVNFFSSKTIEIKLIKC